MAGTQLVKLESATRMLAEIRTVNDAKKIINLAEAARVYAREVGLGTEAENHATEIKLRAQRKAGEILLEMKEKGERHNGHGDQKSESQPAIPKLKDLDITLSDASRWQQVAELPKSKFDNIIEEVKIERRKLSTSGILRAFKEIQKEQRRAEQVKRGTEAKKADDLFQLIHSPIETLEIEPDSIDAIITDPPYPEEYLPLYEILAERAGQWLKPGGSLVVMIGESYLPAIISMLSKYLTYQWTLAYLTPAATCQVFDRKVMCGWKPILWFVKGEYKGEWIWDVCKSDAPDKEHHDWGQSETGMSQLVERFSKSGDLVLDPFMGAGTTGAMAIKLGRRFIGADSDIEQVHITAARLQKE